MVTIYSLIDPDSRKIRYIGQTRVGLVDRLRGHIHNALKFSHTRKSKWIQSLADIGLKPEIVSIEKTDENNCDDREDYWICYYRSLGYNLLNILPGGKQWKSFAKLSKAISDSLRGRQGRPIGQEERRRISERQLGHSVSEETRRKLSEAAKRRYAAIPPELRKLSKTTRNKMSISKKGIIVFSEEHKRHMSEAGHRRKATDEHRKNISEALKRKYANKPKKKKIYKKQNDEARREKISKSQKIRWAKIKTLFDAEKEINNA